jgi:hypothetical protein
MKWYLILMGCFLGACNSNSSKEKSVQSQEEKSLRVIDSATLISGCYTALLKKDTSELVLQYTKDSRSISGTLTIKNFEKDSNKGTINGRIEGGNIVAWYDFFSEGKNSVRQIVFKIQGDTLFEGYGNIIAKPESDTVKFENMEALKYLSNMPYIKGECK